MVIVLFNVITVQRKFSRVVNFTNFTVSLQNAKIITVKINRRLVTWIIVMLAIREKNFFCEIKILTNPQNL